MKADWPSIRGTKREYPGGKKFVNRLRDEEATRKKVCFLKRFWNIWMGVI